MMKLIIGNMILLGLGGLACVSWYGTLTFGGFDFYEKNLDDVDAGFSRLVTGRFGPGKSWSDYDFQ